MTTGEHHRVWHPFTQSQTAPAPLKVLSGKGTKLCLEDGRQVIDMISSWWVNLHGHAHPEIAESIYRQALQLEQVIFAGFTHEPAEEFASELLALINSNFVRDDKSSHPLDKMRRAALQGSSGESGINTSASPFKHVFYSDNGSTAVEVALKMAFQYWRNIDRSEKTGFVCFEGGYHGDTVGAMSIGGASPFWGQFKPLMFDVKTVPYATTFDGDAYARENEEEAIQTLRKVLEESSHELAAVILEPLIQGAGGMKMCRPSFLSKIRELANQFEVLLIFDEVMTGFGRTGDWFAATKSRTIPDILCVSKGITGGFLPLSATLCSARIYDAFLSQDWTKMLMHGHSYTANPLALAAARASLKILQRDRQVFMDMERRHRRLYHQFLASNDNLKRARFCGTVFAVDLESKTDGYFNEIGPRLREEFLNRGLLIRPLGNTIYLLPPYCVTDEELHSAYEAISDIVHGLTNKSLATLTQ